MPGEVIHTTRRTGKGKKRQPCEFGLNSVLVFCPVLESPRAFPGLLLDLDTFSGWDELIKLCFVMRVCFPSFYKPTYNTCVLFPF